MRRNSPESQEMSLNTGIMVPIALGIGIYYNVGMLNVL